MGIIKVTTTSNSGSGSLRRAIADAANLPGEDIIDFSAITGQTIKANIIRDRNDNIIISEALFPLIDEDNDIEFKGAGVTIDGGNLGRIFKINGADVDFSDLNLINGEALDGGDVITIGGGAVAGGALFINTGSSVRVDNVSFNSNSAIAGGEGGFGNGLGGAIFVNRDANLSIFDSTFNNNQALGSADGNLGQGKGGAIYVSNGAKVIVDNLTFGIGELKNNASSSQDKPNDNDNISGTINDAILLSIASSATIEEGSTSDIAITLTEPALRGGLVVNYTLGGNATSGEDYLPLVPANVFIPEGETTGSIEVTALQDVGTEANENLTITLNEIVNEAGEILNYRLDSNKSTTATITITDKNLEFPPNINPNDIVIVETQDSTDVIEGGISDNYFVALGSQPNTNVTIDVATDGQIQNISPLTFTPDNWNTFQTVKVSALKDNIAEENHTSQIIHTVTGGNYQTRSLTVNIAEIIDSQKTAEGLESALNRLQAIIEDQLLSLEIPLVGSLESIAPDFIGTFKDTLLNKIETAKNLTAQDFKNLLESTIEAEFNRQRIALEVQVDAAVSAQEVTFDVSLGNTYLKNIDLSSDLGLPGLGLNIDGQASMNFDYGLDLSFGIHDDFGFFVDTSKTELTAGASLELGEGFEAESRLGLLQVDFLNDANNPTKAAIEFGFGLEDLDNIPNARDDGDRLTIDELQQDFEFKELFTPILNGSLHVGLNSKTKLAGVSALPSFLFDLAIDWDAFGYDENGEFQDLSSPTVDFNNLEVDLNSFISDFAKPALKQISDVIEPLRPIIDVLNTDTKLFTALGIDNLFGKRLDTNNNGQVSLLELVAALPGSRVNTGFIDAVTKVANLSQLITEIEASNEPITLALGSYSLGKFDANTDVATITPQAKGTVENSNAQINRLPNSKKKTVLQGFTNDTAIDIPLLTDPLTGISLLLDKPDVTLFNYDLPELELGLNLRQEFPIFGPIKGLLEGDIDLSANLDFGFDSFGLNQWQNLGFATDQAFRVLDGFFVNDLDSNGNDVPEINLKASLAAGAGLDILVASGYLKGGIQGILNLDLVDVGENSGTSDGKIRASEITSRLDTPGELVDVAGRINAFLGAEVKLFGGTVYNNHFANIPLLEFNSGARGTNRGIGADGYIAGGTVFFDANFNKILDPNEPFTVTNADGSYDLDIPLYLFDVDADDILDPQEGQIVIIDGVDISTNLPQTTPLVALLDAETNASSPEEIVKTFVSPLNTITAELSQPDFNAAQNKIKSILALPFVDYLNYDPLEAIKRGENDGLLVLTQQVKLQNYIFQTTQIIRDAFPLSPEDNISSPSTEDIALTVFNVIKEEFARNNIVNSSNRKYIRGLMERAISNFAELEPDLEISVAVRSDAAEEIASNNQKIDDKRDEIIANEDIASVNISEAIGSYILNPDVSAEIPQIVRSPLNTLMRVLAEPKMTREESEDIIQSQLDLPGVDLLTYNALEAIENGDEEERELGLTIFSEQAKLQNTIVQTTNFLETQVDNPDINIANLFIEQFANNVQSDDFNPNSEDEVTALSNSVTLSNLVSDTINAIPDNDDLSTDVSIEEITNSIQQNNQNIDDIVANDNLTLEEKATQIAQVQQSAQSPQDLETLVVNNPTERPDINNSVPVAKSDFVQISQGNLNPITINVLNNDSDADGDDLTITGVYSADAIDEANETNFVKEEVTINDDRTLTYTPGEDFDGKDSFYYVVTDGKDFANAEVVIQESDLNSPIYRFQNSSIPGTYLFVGESERQSILTNFPNFMEEGLAFNVAVEPKDDLIPLYRFQSLITPGTYLFAGEQERLSINQNFSDSFVEEGLAFYVYGVGTAKGTEFTRFQNSDRPGTYLFVGEQEAESIRANFPNFIEEGAAFEVVI